MNQKRTRVNDFHICIPMVWKFSLDTLLVLHSVWPQNEQTCVSKRAQHPLFSSLPFSPPLNMATLRQHFYHLLPQGDLLDSVLYRLHSPTPSLETDSFFQWCVVDAWIYSKEDLWWVSPTMVKTSPHANLLDSLNQTVLVSDATISVHEKKTNIILLPPIPSLLFPVMRHLQPLW